MAIVNSIIAWINYKRIYQIDLYRDHARDIQEELLFDLIGSARDCEWGKKYDYSSITRPEQFRDMRIPDVLRSGDHQAIARWRQQQATTRTQERRPDLLTSDDDG